MFLQVMSREEEEVTLESTDLYDKVTRWAGGGLSRKLWATRM